QTHVVVVGSLQNPIAVTFNPNTITAGKGDVVQYQFVSVNHTATQAARSQSACKPAQNAVNCGFMPVQQGASRVKTFSMVVQDTQPMYMYCATANHYVSHNFFDLCSSFPHSLTPSQLAKGC
ncbi:hypothetical protein BKA65DRAFT_394213, partial [Rhexocercosporidium sp. MPI-PUGE-AT-0058]